MATDRRLDVVLALLRSTTAKGSFWGSVAFQSLEKKVQR